MLKYIEGILSSIRCSVFKAEFAFRLDHRTSATRGKLFYQFKQHAVMVDIVQTSILKGDLNDKGNYLN